MLGRRKEVTWPASERRSPAVVLIVNDDPDACEMLMRMISARGHPAIAAVGADEAVGRLAADMPRGIVLDLLEGGIGTSLKLLDAIRSHQDTRVSTARVVLCAASAKNRSFAFQSGADSFIVRPFHIDELVSELADALTRPHEDRARHRRDELARHAD